MEIVSALISAVLFYAFVPGVLLTLPKGGSRATILVTHAVLFALTVSLVMKVYWTGSLEFMTNYGAVCPNGYVEGVSKTGAPDCVPVGHVTYAPGKPSNGLPQQ